jgi:hypothetical protein
VETVTQAVKAGRGEELANLYEASAFKAKNDGVLAGYMGELPEDLPVSVRPAAAAAAAAHLQATPQQAS